MASFIYFLPGGEGDAVERLRALGFSHVMEYGAPSVMAQKGPEGDGFLVVPAGKSPAAPVYTPEAQTWKRCAGGKIWVGYETGKPPTPGDLERKTLAGGYVLEGADGNTYVVPPARMFPAREELSEAGDRLERHVLAQYVEMSREAEIFLDLVRGLGGLAKLGEIEQFNMASRVLGINYCVGPWEVSTLQLLTAETRQLALREFLDFPVFEDVAKELEKNGDGEADTPSGVDTTSGDEG